MSHTDLAIRDQIQALDLKLFRLSVTAEPSQKLPIKIPLKPMKSVAHVIDKVRYLRFSRSKGYHIGLIALPESDFIVVKSDNNALLSALQTHTQVLYWNALQYEAWLAHDAWNNDIGAHLTQAAICYRILNVAQGEACLAGFA